MPDNKQAGAQAPARTSIPIDPVAAVFKARAEAAESLCLTLAAQNRELIAQIAVLRAAQETKEAE